jgi:hypothetical protein
MLIFAGHQELAIRGDQITSQQVVDGEPEATHQVADPATQSQPADSGMSDDATGHRQSERLALVVDVSPQATALGPNRSGQRVNPYASHLGEIDHQAVVTHRVPGHGMCPAADRDRQVPLASQTHRSEHVSGPGTAGDEGGPTLDLPIPDLPGRLEALVVRFQKVSQKPWDLHHTFLHPICRVRSIVLCVLAKEKCNV